MRDVLEWREAAAEALQEKINAMIVDRDETMREYNEAIKGLELQVKRILNPNHDVDLREQANKYIKNLISVVPTADDLGRKAYEFLRKDTSRSYSHDDLMRGIGHRGKALASVILRPYIQAGKVRTNGSGRGLAYYVPESRR